MSPICPPGFKKGRAVDLCQQAGCERLHVCGWDLPESSAYLCQRPPVAHPGLLRPHWRGVRTAFTTQFDCKNVCAVTPLCFYVAKVFFQLCSNTLYRDFILILVYLHFSIPPALPPPSLHPNVLFTSRLCQGLEWMMSRLRVRWWPLTLIKSAPLLFIFSASRHELEMRMGLRSVDGWPCPLSCDADVDRLLSGRYILLW